MLKSGHWSHEIQLRCTLEENSSDFGPALNFAVQDFHNQCRKTFAGEAQRYLKRSLCWASQCKVHLFAGTAIKETKYDAQSEETDFADNADADQITLK